MIENHYKLVIGNILANLEHQHLAVKIQAAVSIRFYLKKEETKPIIENLVATIVDHVLKILEETEFEDLVLTLQDFVV